MSILREIQSRKKDRRTVLVVAWVALFLALASAFFFRWEESGSEAYKTFVVRSWSIRETISGEGKSLYRGYYNLAFPISGKVAGIHKRVGETVKKGEPIVSLDDTYVRFDLEKANIALETAEANLVAKQATAPSGEEIHISEEQLEQALLSLGNTKRQANSDVSIAEKSLETAKLHLQSAERDLAATKIDTETTLHNSRDTVALAEKEWKNAQNDLAQILSNGSGSLRDLREKGFLSIDSMIHILAKDFEDVDNILGVTPANRAKNDLFEPYLGARDINTKVRAERTFHGAKTTFDLFLVDWEKVHSNPPYGETLVYMERFSRVSDLVMNLLSDTLIMLRNSVSSSSFSEASIDASITLLDSELSLLKSQNTLFVGTRQAIATEESGLTSEERTRLGNIDILASRLDLAKSAFEKTKSNTDLTLLTYQSKLDLARKEVESSELQYMTVKKRGEEAITSASKQADIAWASLDVKRKRVSPEELAPYEIAIRTAKNALEEAKQRLSDTVLASSVDGVITAIDAEIGEEILPGTPFVSLVNVSHPYIESNMEEIDIAKIHTGQLVHIVFDALEGVTLTGAVTFVSPASSIDANGIVTYRVDIAFDPGTTGVREGMSATVDYTVHEANNILVVPSEFLSETEGKYSLFSLDQNTSVPVEIGISDGKMTEVKNGVKIGEKIRGK